MNASTGLEVAVVKADQKKNVLITQVNGEQNTAASKVKA